MRDIRDLPMADAGYEQHARELFGLNLPPEEYAARYAHEWYCCSMDDYRYRDPDVERWIHRIGDILFEREGAPSIGNLRRQYLMEEERRAIEARATEEF